MIKKCLQCNKEILKRQNVFCGRICYTNSLKGMKPSDAIRIKRATALKNAYSNNEIRERLSEIRLRLDIGNGRTLCVPCHRQTSTWGGRTKNEITSSLT